LEAFPCHKCHVGQRRMDSMHKLLANISLIKETPDSFHKNCIGSPGVCHILRNEAMSVKGLLLKMGALGKLGYNVHGGGRRRSESCFPRRR